MKAPIAILLLGILLVAACKKDPADELADYELLQNQLVGTYDVTCMSYYWHMNFDSPPYTTYSDTDYYYETWHIAKTGLPDDSNILLNDTLMTWLGNEGLRDYSETYGVGSRILELDFVAPDSIYTFRKLGGGLGGGNNIKCAGKKR
jgi:hypothetical protein